MCKCKCLLMWSIACAAIMLTGPGCAGMGKARELKKDDLSENAVVLPVALIYQKEKHECGLTCVNMLLTYYGVRFDDEISAVFNKKAEDLAEQDKQAGISAVTLKEYLIAKGFDVFIFSGEIDSSPNGMYTHIDKGRPLIVMIGSGRDTNHYLLVTGYDKQNSRIILQDPIRGPLLLPDWQFAVNWERCRKFTLLAVPRETVKTAEN